MAAIVRPNQAHQPSVAPRPHPTRSRRPQLVMVQGGRSPERLAEVYRRRRLGALALALVLLSGLLLGGRALALAVAPAPPGSRPAAAASAPAVTESVVVQPGDTLWALARRLQPEGDVRPLVDRLADAHGPGPLQPGEVIEVAMDRG